ncbi:MAG: thiamine pyrophosphate-binding protein [bacterium]
MFTKEALIRQLIAEGVTYIFGNPGTSEESFNDALSDFSDIKYILCLHETMAIAMGDAYARAARKPAFVQLHCSVGTGNAIGMLYQAKRGCAPLIVLAGEGPLDIYNMDAQMAANLQELARPVTKWCTQIRRGSEVARMLRRAVKVATTPPYGPVYLSFPMDCLDEEVNVEIRPATRISTRVSPDQAFIQEAISLLLSAENPIFIMGDGLAFSDAKQEAEKFAEILGCPIYGADSAEVNVSFEYPLFMGLTGHMFGSSSREIVKDADVVFICGSYVFPEVFPLTENVFAQNAKIIHIDLDTWEIGKNFVADLAIMADPKLSLAALCEELEKRMTEKDRAKAKKRFDTFHQKALDERNEAIAKDDITMDLTPIRPARLMRELSRFITPETLIFDEAITCSEQLLRYIRPSRAGQFFQVREGILGVGIPGGIGLKLAHPDRPVVAIVGDGGGSFGIHALYTAARYDIPVVFIICNNASYKILKYNLLSYWGNPQPPERPFPDNMDLVHPRLNFKKLAEGMGVAGFHVEDPSELAPVLDKAFRMGKPCLVDVFLDNSLS